MASGNTGAIQTQTLSPGVYSPVDRTGRQTDKYSLGLDVDSNKPSQGCVAYKLNCPRQPRLGAAETAWSRGVVGWARKGLDSSAE